MPAPQIFPGYVQQYVVLPLADFRPDAGPLEGGNAQVSGVYPVTANAYAPLRQTVTIATAGTFPTGAPLNGTAKVLGGAGAGEDLTTGKPQYFAATGGDLFQVVNGAYATVGTGFNGYAHWWFAQFKNLMIAASPYDGLYSQNLASPGTNFALLSSSAPKAWYAATISDFLMVANTDDPTGGLGPFRAWWSAIGDPTNWPTPGSTSAQQVQSDYNDFYSDQGQITGICGALASCNGALFFERGVQSITYVGPPAIFSFQAIPNTPGTIAPRSVVRVGKLAYYFSQDGFRVTDGSSSKQIGIGRVDNFALQNWDHNAFHFLGAYDDGLKCIIWTFCSGLLGVETFDTTLIYSPTFDKWTTGGPHLTWLFQSVIEPHGSSASTGLLTVGMIDTNYNYVVMGSPQFFGSAATPTLSATISTVERQPIPGRRAFVRNSRPLIDGGTPYVNVNYRDSLTGTLNFGPYVSMNSAGSCPQRINARFTQANITTNAGDVWNTVEGVEVEAVPGGLR